MDNMQAINLEHFTLTQVQGFKEELNSDTVELSERIEWNPDVCKIYWAKL